MRNHRVTRSWSSFIPAVLVRAGTPFNARTTFFYSNERSTWSNQSPYPHRLAFRGWQAFGYGVLPGGDADEVEIPNNIDVNTLV